MIFRSKASVYFAIPLGDFSAIGTKRRNIRYLPAQVTDSVFLFSNTCSDFDSCFRVKFSHFNPVKLGASHHSAFFDSDIWPFHRKEMLFSFSNYFSFFFIERHEDFASLSSCSPCGKFATNAHLKLCPDAAIWLDSFAPECRWCEVGQDGRFEPAPHPRLQLLPLLPRTSSVTRLAFRRKEVRANLGFWQVQDPETLAQANAILDDWSPCASLFIWLTEGRGRDPAFSRELRKPRSQAVYI